MFNGVIQPPAGTKIKKIYGKNHQIPLKERVPLEDQVFPDWEEYDPEEDYEDYSEEDYEDYSEEDYLLKK